MSRAKNARAVGDEPPLAQGRDPEAELAERDQRDLLVVQGQAVLERFQWIALTVDLEVEAAEAGMHLDPHVRTRRDDERRSAAAVHRQRRAHQGRHTGRDQRAAGGHRVGARSERGRDDQPIARQPHVELVVGEHAHDQLSGAAPRDHEIVERPFIPPIRGVDRDRRESARRPVAAERACERVLQRLAAHGRERAEASARHAEDRHVLAGSRPKCREHGAVTAERDHEIARLELSRPSHLAARAAKRLDLHDVEAMLPRPRLQRLERTRDLTGGMDHDGQT